jgi:hypothetical protein
MNPETFKTLQGPRFPSALIYSSDYYEAIDQEQAIFPPDAKFLDEVSTIAILDGR